MARAEAQQQRVVDPDHRRELATRDAPASRSFFFQTSRALAVALRLQQRSSANGRENSAISTLETQRQAEKGALLRTHPCFQPMVSRQMDTLAGAEPRFGIATAKSPSLR